MRQLSPSSVMFLPFGSLSGVIPVDAIARGRVLGDFSRVLDPDRGIAGSVAASVVAGSYPACAAWPPSLSPSGDGGI